MKLLCEITPWHANFNIWSKPFGTLFKTLKFTYMWIKINLDTMLDAMLHRCDVLCMLPTNKLLAFDSKLLNWEPKSCSVLFRYFFHLFSWRRQTWCKMEQFSSFVSFYNSSWLLMRILRSRSITMNWKVFLFFFGSAMCHEYKQSTNVPWQLPYFRGYFPLYCDFFPRNKFLHHILAWKLNLMTFIVCASSWAFGRAKTFFSGKFNHDLISNCL